MSDRKKIARDDLINPSLVKLLVSFVVAAAAWALSEYVQDGGKDDTQNAMSLLLTVFAGSVAYAVQHLMALERQNDAIRLELREGLGRINEATELFGAVETSAVQIDLVTQLVQNATAVDKQMPPLVQAFAQTEIFRLSTLLRELGEGDVTYEGEDRDWLLGLARNTETSIDALSLAIVDQSVDEFDGGFWATDAGQRYLDIQRERARNGVTIRRIFYLDDIDQLSGEMFRRISRMHLAAGVQVRTLTKSQLTSPLGVDDFIVFDGVVSYEITPSQTLAIGELATHTFIRTLLILETPRVRQRIEKFRELWSLAEELPR